jgi:ABC-type molybdate transport system permease subunit
MILAGTPVATTLSGKDFVTTALAPTVTLFPMAIPPNIFAPAPNTLLDNLVRQIG